MTAGGYMGREQADPFGLMIATVAQESDPSVTVILFGSRARGDHRPDSDVDLLVVWDDTLPRPAPRSKAESDAARHEFFQRLGNVGLDNISMTRRQFGYCRRARNHIAAQALRDGVIMNDDDFSDLCDEDFDDGYHVGWPDIRQRLINARRWLGSMNHNIDTGNHDQELIGFAAQQAVENALKGWISALDCEYRNIHHLKELADIVLDNTDEGSSPARAELEALVEYTALTEAQRAALRLNDREPHDWLSLYAVLYRYGGVERRLDLAGYRDLQERITRAVTAFVDEAFRITGTGAGDLERRE